jgi:hypothetical protein
VTIPAGVTSYCTRIKTWRRGSKSNGVFTGCQPQYPDLQGDFNVGFTGVQALLDTIQLNPPETRHTHAAYSVIEGIVEGFCSGEKT